MGATGKIIGRSKVAFFCEILHERGNWLTSLASLVIESLEFERRVVVRMNEQKCLISNKW